MFYVDRDIRRLIDKGEVTIHSIDGDRPFDPSAQIGAGTIDLRLGNRMLRYKQNVGIIDLTRKDMTEAFDVPDDEEFVIQPHEVIIATTLEIVILPANIAGLIMGRSSIARLGLIVHATQEYMSPGMRQLVALQLVNVNNHPIKIRPFISICQIMLLSGSAEAEVPYNQKANAKYRDELSGPQASKISEDFQESTVQPATTIIYDEKHKQVLADIERLTKLKEASNEDGLSEFRTKLSRIMTLIYIILGAAISVLIQELDVKPFPSLELVISGAFILLCVVIIAVANWKK